jgi:hypothetical protein
MPACDERPRSALDREGAVPIPHDGVPIDAMTSYPRWDGTPPDYAHIVSTLIPPATQ